MLKLLAAIVGLVVLLLAVRTCSGTGSELPADPVTSSANLNLRLQAQARIEVEIASLSNRLKQVMAAGNEPAQRQALDPELAKLHVDVDAARTKLTTLGDPPAAIDQWLTRIGWPEFERLEADYRKADGQ